MDSGMKGFLGIGTIFMWLGIFTIFGGAVYGAIDDATVCVLGGGCNPLVNSMGKLVFAPQQKMADAIDDYVLKNEAGTLTEAEASYARNQIVSGALIFVVLFVLLYWVGTKLFSIINFFDRIMVAFFVICALAASQMIFTYLTTGIISMPFIGFIKLYFHPEVLIGIINTSEMLPLNMTINETI